MEPYAYISMGSLLHALYYEIAPLKDYPITKLDHKI